jgi:hypothetical protein
MDSRNAFCLIAGLVVGGWMSTVHAGQTISFDGVQYASGHFETMQLEPGHSYSLIKEWRAIHVAPDQAAVVHLTRVECSGFIDARADGTFSADGLCNHWDRDGDHWVGHWWNNSKMSVGQFEVVSGNGKYAGAKGGGTSDCKFLKPGPDPQAACYNKATIQLK